MMHIFLHYMVCICSRENNLMAACSIVTCTTNPICSNQLVQVHNSRVERTTIQVVVRPRAKLNVRGRRRNICGASFLRQLSYGFGDAHARFIFWKAKPYQVFISSNSSVACAAREGDPPHLRPVQGRKTGRRLNDLHFQACMPQIRAPGLGNNLG